ncbi:MAG: ribonuclease D [Proteobacteria bacterium]|nr:ribonuclease D [Pseudomonadota bacterium]NDG25864.1 ribonuclease D [Pseudomonadota bacterium]
MKRARPQLLTTVDQVLQASRAIQQASVIGVDTEFIRETSFYPRIALIQVATENEVWLFDPTILTKNELEPLLKIFVDSNCLKIFHASQADQECLFWTYGVLASPVLDTSVAAGLCGMGDSIGLQKLLRETLDIHVPKGRARAKWLSRPLSDELLHYAEEDVAHLVRLTKKLKSKLVSLDRWDWALEESRVDAKVFDVSPDDLTQKIVCTLLSINC